jgi:hypothetical protein
MKPPQRPVLRFPLQVDAMGGSADGSAISLKRSAAACVSLDEGPGV